MPHFQDDGRDDHGPPDGAFDRELHVVASQGAFAFSWSWSIYRSDDDEPIASSVHMFANRAVALRVGNCIKRSRCAASRRLRNRIGGLVRIL